MKFTKLIICLGLFLTVTASQVEAKKHNVQQKPVYMVGICMSLVDSVIFITDMHQVDNVTIENKTHFLMDRQLYSLQLKQFVQSHYKGGPYIPAVYSSTSRKKMERRYLSLHKRYVKSKELRMYLLDQSQFRFKPETYVDNTVVSENSAEKGPKKSSKK